MKKRTKRAKRVTVNWKEVESVSYISVYLCPSCGTTFEGGGPSMRTTRFRCSCGQELIVDMNIQEGDV